MAREFLTSPNLKAALLLNDAAGTSGQVLTSAGAGAVPTWSTISGNQDYGLITGSVTGTLDYGALT
jgi:hypothetical protein